jgi:LysR family transcriptional regulator, regulator for metE and metH
MDLDVRHLKLVSVLATTSNMTRAAQELNVTQSALSHQLRDIEDRLGTRLFERRSRKMALTPPGQRLLATARQVLEALEQVEREVRGSAGPRSVLRLTTECYTCYHWLPELLRGYHQDHADVDVQIVVDATRRPLPALLEDQVDLAIVIGDPRHARVAFRPLFADELVAVMAPGHRLLKRPYLVAEDFRDEHLVLYDAPKEELSIFTRVLVPARVSPRRVSHVQLTEAILEMVKSGLGIGVMARWVALPQLREGSLEARPVTAHGLPRSWGAAWLRRKKTPPHLDDFVERLVKRSLPTLRRVTGGRGREAAAPPITSSRRR